MEARLAIKSLAEFDRLRKALASDILDAHAHWRMGSDLRSSLEIFPSVSTQSNTFWYLTLRAHDTAALQHLCRAFDQEKTSLHLLNWLQIIQSNLYLFENQELRKRLKDNPYVDSLLENAAAPDATKLREDIKLCCASEPLVKKLMTYRNNQSAHRGIRTTERLQQGAANYALSDDHIQPLLDRALSILNCYSRMFSAETYLPPMVGRHDYKFIFSSVEVAVKNLGLVA